jgi:hypothetical protein
MPMVAAPQKGDPIANENYKALTVRLYATIAEVFRTGIARYWIRSWLPIWSITRRPQAQWLGASRASS